jgi:hypothetical protein
MAIALAQKMSAKSWELRAKTSLARLLAKQGQRDEAHAMLVGENAGRATVLTRFSGGAKADSKG